MKTILIVEDDDDIRESLRMLLQDEGYSIETARDGCEALKALERERPALMLLDLMMPTMDGNAVLDHLHAEPRWADLPVVVLTAANQAPIRKVSCVLKKPIDLDMLLSVSQRFTD